MSRSARPWLYAAGFAAAALAAVPALASHGKAGLWEITVHMNMAGMQQMMSPAEAARMRQMGVKMPGNQTMTVKHCMTPQEVAMDKPPSMDHQHSCTMQNMKITGQSFTGDMVCHGEMNGTARINVSYDSAEHYAGSWTFDGMMHGHPAKMTNSFDGKWVSADCGSVKPVVYPH